MAAHPEFTTNDYYRYYLITSSLVGLEGESEDSEEKFPNLPNLLLNLFNSNLIDSRAVAHTLVCLDTRLLGRFAKSFQSQLNHELKKVNASNWTILAKFLNDLSLPPEIVSNPHLTNKHQEFLRAQFHREMTVVLFRWQEPTDDRSLSEVYGQVCQLVCTEDECLDRCLYPFETLSREIYVVDNFQVSKVLAWDLLNDLLMGRTKFGPETISNLYARFAKELAMLKYNE